MQRSRAKSRRRTGRLTSASPTIMDFHLRRRRRWDAALAHLLEGVAQLEKARLATRRAREADTERRRARLESVRKRRRLKVCNQAERDDDRGVARSRRDVSPGSAGKEQRVELML